jgi:site-specific DNA-methyltransferase (adenine-specific)
MLELPQNITHTQIGENTLINADCFDVFPHIKDQSVDAIIADLPFFGVVKDDWDNQWKTEKEYLEWCKEVIIQYKRVLKDNGNIFLFTGRQYNRKISCILDDYFTEKRIIIWARKRNFNATRGTALASGYEPLCYYSKGQGIFNNIKIQVDSKRKEYTEGFLKDGISLSDVWTDIPALPHNSKEKVNHPTQKPLKLIDRIVKIGTNEGDLILDNVCGSGTTGLASINLGRKFIGIEKEQKYYEIAVKRIEDALTQINSKPTQLF